jgi:hypothetical protein
VRVETNRKLEIRRSKIEGRRKRKQTLGKMVRRVLRAQEGVGKYPAGVTQPTLFPV